MDDELIKLGAIVTRNIALGLAVILYGERSNPIAPEDSGWQFSEGSRDLSNAQNAQIWTVGEVLELDQTLKSLINLPIGSKILRNAKDDTWRLMDD